MKRLIALTLCLMLLLCACAPQDPSGTTEGTTPSTTEGSTPSASANDGTTDGTEASVNDLKALAESCIGKTVQELYDLIGEPDSAEYVTSCLGPGEDGNLFYDGFIVYTYREGDSETVEYVE